MLVINHNKKVFGLMLAFGAIFIVLSIIANSDVVREVDAELIGPSGETRILFKRQADSTTNKPKHLKTKYGDSTTTKEPSLAEESNTSTTTAKTSAPTTKPTTDANSTSSSPSRKKKKLRKHSTTTTTAPGERTTPKALSSGTTAKADIAKKNETSQPLLSMTRRRGLAIHERNALDHLNAGIQNWARVLQETDGEILNAVSAGEFFLRLQKKVVPKLKRPPEKLMQVYTDFVLGS